MLENLSLERIFNSITNWFTKDRKRILLITFIVGLLVHFELISKELLAYDGYWHYGTMLAKGWEISLGRFLIPFSDMFRGSVVVSILTTALSLIAIGFASIFLIETLKIKKTYLKIAISILMVVTPTISLTFMYAYTAFGYSLALLFSVLSVYFLNKAKNKKNIILSIICIVATLGFYQAYFNENTCISCGKCRAVCPYLNYKTNKELKECKLYSYIDYDKEVLKTSSSGGLAYRIAKQSLENNCAVCGCVYDEVKHSAKHVIISPSEKNKLKYLQGSKYLQSKFYDVISQINNNMVVFGTPCQIASVRALYGNKYNLLLVDLICHGVPSYNLYQKYMEYLSSNKELDVSKKFKTVFRYKEKGWRERYIYNENQEKSFCASQKKDPFFLFFEHGFCYSKSCYECPWRDKSAADIRLGDYWHRKYSKNNTGISMVVAITEKGESCISRISDEKLGSLKSEPILDYFECQQIKNNVRPVFWEELISDLNSKKSISEILEEYIMPYERLKNLRNIYNDIKNVKKK